MNPCTCARANASSVSHAGLDVSGTFVIFVIGRWLHFVAGIPPGVIRLTRKGVTAFRLFPHFQTIALMWLAFGLAFYALALRAPRTWPTWCLLLAAWFLAWLPHGIIGIGFALAGSNEPSIRLYREWASAWPGFIRLCASVAILLAHFGLSGFGFVATGRTLRRSPGTAGA